MRSMSAKFFIGSLYFRPSDFTIVTRVITLFCLKMIQKIEIVTRLITFLFDVDSKNRNCHKGDNFVLFDDSKK